MEHLKAFLKNKQAQDQSKAPKYGMRKLSVGFVSCFLGCAVFMAPMGVHAESEAAPAPVAAVETQAKPAEAKPVEVKSVEATEASVAEASSAEATVAEASSAEADTTIGENAAFETQDTTVERETESEAAAVAVADQVETAEAEAPKQEAAAEKKAVDTKDEEKSAEVETADSADKDSEDQTSEEKPQAVDAKSSEAEGGDQTQVDDAKAEIKAFAEVLGRSNEVDPEAQTAGAASEGTQREPKDISNEIQDRQVHLNTEKLIADENARITEENKKRPSFDQKPLIPEEGPAHIHPDDGEPIGYEVAFTSPRGSIGGDHFTIKLSDTLKIQGIEPYTTEADPLVVGDKTIATGERLDNQTIKYTFTNEINDIRNVRVSIKGYAYVNKAVVPNSKEETFSVALGDKKDEKPIKVNYGEVYYTGDKLNGKSQITEFDPKTGAYTQVFYINPKSETITTSTKNWATGKVAIFIDGITPDGTPSDVKYTEENTKVSVQKLPAGKEVPGAIIESPVEENEKTIVNTIFRDGGIEITFAENGDGNLRHNNIDSPYIVTVKSTATPSKTGSNLYSRATFYGDGTRFHIMDNAIVSVVGDNEAQGQQVGYFIEHHVYKTKVDGVLQEDKTFTIDSNKMEGADYDDYFTDKSEIEDFEFVKVDTDQIKEGAAYNADGSIARGSYKPGKTQEVTYIYERDIKHGSFQEHHIYQSLDEDGNIVVKETVTKEGKETTGFDETTYETSKKDQAGNIVTEEIDKDGYKLVEVNATNENSANLGVQFDGQGAETSGNYVNGEKLEVTYTYQKKVTTKGNFKEHHIYQTVDEDGNVISTDDKLKKDSESTGKETEEFTTSKKDEEGYTLVKVEGTEGTNFKQDGSAQKTNYKKGETQEVTYTYQKKVKKPVTLTPDKPKKSEDPKPGNQTPNEPNKPGEPSKPVNPTPKTPNEPTGWIPVKPVDPKTPENPVKEEPKNPAPQNPVKEDPKNPVPETPVKEEPKNPAPQTPEKPVQPKTVDKKVEKPVESKAEEKETLATDAPVTTKKEVGQPKVSKGDDREGKAPQTFDAGVASYASLAGLASGALAYLESKKRKNK